MKRKITQKLIKWKEESSNIPYMLVGAKQVGKTYILNEFCRENFSNYIYINLDKEKEIKNAFERTIEPKEIIREISIRKGKEINPDNTIIFFDEIQVSERAITSLKYFNEAQEPYKIVCAGSLLGVKLNRFKSSYPVGKVRRVTLNPMDFEEFLWATDNMLLADEIKIHFDNSTQMSVHDLALKLYRDYLFVGGMPASVLEYIKKEGEILNFDRIIKQDLLDAYIVDMSKYTTSTENNKINKLFQSIPMQLSRESKKFTYKIVESSANKRNYETSIDWLIHANLVNKCTIVEIPQIPLAAYQKENIFKIYLNDVGLLCELAEITARNLLGKDANMFRGMLTENYIAQALAANNHKLYYWKSKHEAEIDFLINYQGYIIPVEVKATTNTKAKSLRVYIEKYRPAFSIRISAKNFGYSNKIKSIPLYAVYLLKD